MPRKIVSPSPGPRADEAEAHVLGLAALLEVVGHRPQLPGKKLECADFGGFR